GSERDVVAAAGRGQAGECAEREQRGDGGRTRAQIGRRGEECGGNGCERGDVQLSLGGHTGQDGVGQRLRDEDEGSADAADKVAEFDPGSATRSRRAGTQWRKRAVNAASTARR